MTNTKSDNALIMFFNGAAVLVAYGMLGLSLYLSTEVGMSRCVEDVDLDVAPFYGAVLRRDRDPALPLEIHAVHHAVSDLLI